MSSRLQKNLEAANKYWVIKAKEAFSQLPLTYDPRRRENEPTEVSFSQSRFDVFAFCRSLATSHRSQSFLKSRGQAPKNCYKNKNANFKLAKHRK
jgi:hypothetical protein